MCQNIYHLSYMCVWWNFINEDTFDAYYEEQHHYTSYLTICVNTYIICHICVFGGISLMRTLLMPIMRKMNLINLHFWTYFNLIGKRQAWGSGKRFSWALSLPCVSALPRAFYSRSHRRAPATQVNCFSFFLFFPCANYKLIFCFSVTQNGESGEKVDIFLF